MAELGANDAGIAVRPGDLAPDDLYKLSAPNSSYQNFCIPYPDLGALDLALRTVDKSDALAEVESGVLGGVDTLNLDQRGVRVGVALATLEGQVLALKKGMPVSRPFSCSLRSQIVAVSFNNSTF